MKVDYRKRQLENAQVGGNRLLAGGGVGAPRRVGKLLQRVTCTVCASLELRWPMHTVMPEQPAACPFMILPRR